MIYENFYTLINDHFALLLNFTIFSIMCHRKKARFLL